MRFLVIALLLFPQLAFAYGEVVGDSPSPEERALHFFTDRLRVDPDATDPQFEDLPPVRALIYNADLNEAARFYAEDMAANGCFPADHSSCDGTPFGERVGGFYSGEAIGENILLGIPGAEATVFDGWLYSDGHRANMLSSLFNELGTGYARGDRALWVQDFGKRSGLPEPLTTSGTVWPLNPSPTSSATFYVALHDPEGGSPASVEVYVNEDWHDLHADRGMPGNRTWAGSAPVGPEGCRSYVFRVTKSDGDVVLYPSEGALVFPVGDVSCDWADPEAEAGVTPTTGGLGGTGTGCANPGGGQADPDANVSGDDVQYGSCSVASRRPEVSLLLLVALAARRRR